MEKRTRWIVMLEILGLLLLYGLMHFDYLKFIPSCWIYQTTGLLCPACGGTRCVIFMLQGKWIQAFFSHMVFFIGILYLLVLNILVIINLNKEKKMATWWYPKWWYTIIFAIVWLGYAILRNMI